MAVKGTNIPGRMKRLSEAWHIAVSAGDMPRARLARIAFFRLVDHQAKG